MRMNSAKQSQLTAVASITTKSSRHNVFSDQARKNPEYQSEKRAKDDSLPKQDGVISELVETASYASAGLKSGLAASSFKEGQSHTQLGGGRQLKHYRQSSSQSRFNSKLISHPHYDSRKRDNSATQILLNAGDRDGLMKKKEILFN